MSKFLSWKLERIEGWYSIIEALGIKHFILNHRQYNTEAFE